MTNRDIARFFNRLAKIMELHDENVFKIRSYSNAYLSLRKIEQDLSEMPIEDISAIKGVGKNISDKIQELLQTGTLATYQKYVDKTPEGIIKMLDIKGFGPKKIKVVWKELGIENVGELLYACNENRLVELKGFGLKTQATLIKQLEYFIDSQGKFLFDYLEGEANELEGLIKSIFPNQKSTLAGLTKRMMPEVTGIEILSTIEDTDLIEKIEGLQLDEDETMLQYKGYPVFLHHVSKEKFGATAFRMNSGEQFLENIDEIPNGENEEDVFNKLGLTYVVPEYRESATAYEQSKTNQLPKLISDQDIKGVVHNHSTYSDGLHSVKEMGDECVRLGYEYFVMSDHSKAAFYANGLSEDRVMMQMAEIDKLNESYKDFRIFKSIECDILNDGSMDYGDDFLKEFELVIASVHTNLKMDKVKANARLAKAIENPNTHILGHPTGRLLLAREGYPIDHTYIIDACAANGMVIELNSNPSRLDLDWSWVPYALEKGVKISINPDAHSKDQIRYIHAGVCAARKGGLTSEMCLNAMNLAEFSKWVNSL
jgi:DNA polymerase (family 10)